MPKKLVTAKEHAEHMARRFGEIFYELDQEGLIKAYARSNVGEFMKVAARMLPTFAEVRLASDDEAAVPLLVVTPEQLARLPGKLLTLPAREPHELHEPEPYEPEPPTANINTIDVSFSEPNEPNDPLKAPFDDPNDPPLADPQVDDPYGDEFDSVQTMDEFLSEHFQT